jgi:signal transduction histidine kinase
MRALTRLGCAARRHPHTDIVAAAVVYAVTLLTTTAGPDGGRLDAMAVITAAVACGSLAVAGRYPVAVLVVSTAAAEAYLLHFAGSHGSLVLVAPLVALYTVAESATRRRALCIGVVSVLVFAALHVFVKPSSWFGAENLALAALGGLAVAAGDASRNRRAYLAEAQARARQAEAERDAEAARRVTEAARRVTEERLRIARDLHDAVGHQLALIHVQAKVAAHLLETSPAESRQALAHVCEASRTALGELSETVALLRQPGEPAVPTDPVPGLSGVADLLATFRRSGLRITDRVDGESRPIAVPADVTAYRILQESLTNVCKHAGSTDVEVRLTYRPEALRIVIENSPPHPELPDPGPGQPAIRHGLVGMRERVTALGGDLRAEPRPDGGFRVAAVLPLLAGAAA